MKGNYSFANNNYEEENQSEKGILSKTGNMISSFFTKVRDSINPFKADNNFNNPYDIDSLKEPYNYLDGRIPNNNQNLFNSNLPMNINQQEQMKKSNLIYLGDNNYADHPYNNVNNFNYNDQIINNNIENNIISQEENNYISVEDLLKTCPHLREDIFKDFKRPNYIPNEEIFQEAKKYVYNNLVNRYKILKPISNEEKFVESILLLSIQLVNKYNIEMHYEFLVNKKKCIYKLIINVPDIIKQ